MESRPPQEPPRRNSSGGRKPGGPGGSPTPPWLWGFLIAVVILISWLVMPKYEVSVNYSPWFTEQVKNDNIESLSVQGLEVHGKLRAATPYHPPEPQAPITVD